jgi:inhibitor of KinA sporulation pathway (predicted exonuclease)
MTTTVYEAQKVKLIDGTELELKPLSISLLRKFMKNFDKIAKVADDNDKSMTVLMECVQIALEQYKPELAKDAAALEQNIDLPTVYKIVDVASGIKLGEDSFLNNALVTNNA